MKTIHSAARLRAAFMRTFFALFAASLLVLASCAKEEEEPVKKTDTEQIGEHLQSLLNANNFYNIKIVDNSGTQTYDRLEIKGAYMHCYGNPFKDGVQTEPYWYVAVAMVRYWWVEDNCLNIRIL